MSTEKCRCCLSEGAYKDIYNEYLWCNEKEIYFNMINDCFNIKLHTSKSSKICDICIKDLRTSYTFKQRVLKSEENFPKMIMFNQAQGDGSTEIKLEFWTESDDDSKSYHQTDIVRDASIESIKDEPVECNINERSEQLVKKNVEVATRTKGKGKDEKLKCLMTRLDNISSLNIKQMRSLSPRNKTKKGDTIAGISSTIPEKKDLHWTSQSYNFDKTKHRHNLKTIIDSSNAVPFKDKSLLGFACGYCDATFPDPADLRSHTEANHNEDRLRFKFDVKENLVKLDVTDLSCKLCQAGMHNLTVLKDHLVKAHRKTIYTDIKDQILQFKLKMGVYDCALCTSTYETFKMLKQHMNIHYGNYSCDKCDCSFVTKRSLNAHLTTHQKGSFKCDFCDKIFANKTKKHYHMKTIHSGTRNIRNCPFCDMSFRSYYQRNQHLVKVHNSEAQYKCNVCNKSYVLKTLLMYHIKKNHLMEKNFQCVECDHRFFSRKALKAHMVKHSGERNFLCDICHKSYVRKSTLREHLRIHNNDRRFKCDVCETSFVQKCSLKSHLLSNHGISMAASDLFAV